jgi:type IV pilus assembly protein PilC
MENGLVFFNWIVLFPLGVALHWALRLIYGMRRTRPDERLLLALSTAAWLFILVGLLGPLFIMGGLLGLLLLAAFLVVALMVLGRYRESERRALLWALAVAAERELPLSQAARAFAADRTDEIARRADRLADLLETGMSLPEALRRSRNPLPIDAELAARLGHETGQFSSSLKETARQGSRYAPVWEPVLQRMVYFEVLIVVGIGLTVFLMVNVLPSYQYIFTDFQLELPPATQWAIWISHTFVSYWFLFAPLLLALVLLVLYGVLYRCGWLRWEAPGVGWLTRRYHGAIILSALAQAVQMQRPLDTTFVLLAEWYPIRHVRQRLARVVEQIEAGHDWCDALYQAKLIAAADRAVLRAAQRAGNLVWALREMSESVMRRLAYRVGYALNLGFPLLVLLIGGCVALYAYAFIVPMTDLILNMA